MKKIPTILLAVLVILTTGLFAAEGEFSSKTIHMGVIVSDLDKAVDFYTNIIGMEKKASFDIDEQFSKKSGLANGVPFHVEVLKLGEGEEATQWKLISFDQKVNKQNNEFIQSNTGVQYITLFVNSLKPVLKRIQDNNIELLGETPIPLGNGEQHFILVKDPDGTFIELMGPLN